MTEEEWLACQDPIEMCSAPQHSDRKARLLACAFCRQVLNLLDSEWSKQAVELAERFADAKAAREEVLDAIRSSPESIDDEEWFPNACHVPYQTLRAFKASNMPLHIAIEIGRGASSVVGMEPWGLEAQIHQCQMIREFFGNPFRPYPAPDHWPSHVIQLANAIYNGEDCGFALHDALLEAGHPELAEHFCQEQSHPKGCWVVDLRLIRLTRV